jgi:hypothetical protein
MTKICVKCNQEKSLEMFAKGKNYKDGRRGTCKRCHTDYVLSYYDSKPDKKAAKNKMNSVYSGNWKKHGISKEQYIEMLSKYNGKCYSCKDREAVSIDHDHGCCDRSRSCGKCIRGILCNQCNTALGLLQDNKEKIKGLLEYLK